MKPEKIKERVFRGIHFIRIQDLPVDQAESIREHLKGEQIIKIMINREIISDCVQYAHYEEWFDLYLTVDNGQVETVKKSDNRSNFSDTKLLRPTY